MIENLRAMKKLVVGIELVGLILLIVLFYRRSNGDNITDIDLAYMSTSHDVVKYDGTKWRLAAADANELVGDGNVIYGPGIPLRHGTYTIVLDYNTTRIQKGVLEANGGYFETSDYFLLASNKHELRYDFTLETNVDAFRFRLKEYRGGDFELTGITIIRNNHDLMMAILGWIVFSLFINFILYSEKVRNNGTAVVVVLLVALLASIPLFFKGIMTGNDLRYHLVRIEGIAEGLKCKVFPVNMFSVYNDNYGYPVGIYYGDTLLYIPAVLRIIGFNVLQSYKLFIFSINLLTTAIAYCCGRKMFSREITAYIFTIAYSLSTYRLLCLYARAAVGEYSATCFYPLIMLAVWNIYIQDVKQKGYKKNAILLAVGMAGLIYSHILSTEMFVLTLFVIALLFFKKTIRFETFSVFVIAIFVCSLICVGFLVPFLEYYVKVPILLKSTMKSTYIQSEGAYISDYFAFFKSITGGDYESRRGILTPGLLLMSGLVLGIFLIATQRADKKIKVTLCGSIACLLVASNLFPWNHIYKIPVMGSLLVAVQFPYRYIGVSACFLSVLLCLCIERLVDLEIIGTTIYRYAIAIALVMTCVFVSDYQDESFITSIMRPFDTADLYTYTRSKEFGMYLGTIYLMDGTNVNYDALDYGVYGENASGTIVGENGIGMQLSVKSDANGTLRVPRFAYPHMVAKDNRGNLLDTTIGYNNELTVLFAEPYEGDIIIDFEEPGSWRLAELISVITVLALALGLIASNFFERKKAKV